jgi:hypothetical protein
MRIKMTKMRIMPVVASGEIRGAIKERTFSSAPGSGCNTSTGTGRCPGLPTSSDINGLAGGVDDGAFGLSNSFPRIL